MRVFLTRFLFLIGMIWASASVGATELSNGMVSARALGMGNALVSQADDINALFYNPAGLAKVRGVNWTVFSLGAGSKNLTDYRDFENLRSDSDFADTVQGLFGKSLWVGAEGKTGIAVPMFAAAIYNNINGSIAVDNPAYPEINTNVINDYGYTAGFGIPVGPFLQVGFVGRRVKRQGGNRTFRGATVADLDPDAIISELEQWGIGYALDSGANLMIPMPLGNLTMSFVWKNMGRTVYRSDNGSDIPSDDNNIILGMGARLHLPGVTITPEIDYTHLNLTNVQLMRKFNMGVEVGLPLLDLRAGFSEGYYSLGAGVSLGPLRVDAATYGVELGEYPGQKEDRRYMLELSLNLDVGEFSVIDDGTDSSSSSTSSGGSFWGGDGGRLKQRR